MLQKKEFPKLNEGFSRITFCQNDNDVQSAVDTYRALGPLESLPSGYFGQKGTDTKVQVGIMKFLKKVEAPEESASDGVKCQNSTSKEGSKEKDTQCMETETIQINNKKAAEGGKRGDSVGGDISSNSLHTLAFPSISTADFQFNHEKASDIIVESIDEALNKFKNIRLVMVDLSSGSHILSLVKDKAVKKKLDPLRFFTFAGNITLINTEGNLGCTVIANATNWRLKPGGGGVNAAIFSAGGEALKLATKEQAGTISPGKSLVVPLPSTSPLFKREGITHVIHVLGPNMNPERPNYLKNDYVKGCKILCEAYSSLFESFASVVHAQRFQKESCNSSDPGSSYSHKDHTQRNYVDKLFRVDPKNKREDCLESLDSVRNKKYKALPLECGLNDGRDMRHNDFAGCVNHGDESVRLEHNENMTSCSDITISAPQGMIQTKNKKISDSSKKNWSSWAQALHHTAMNPEKHKDDIMHISDDVVVLNDLSPKAKKHILILSRLNGLDQLRDVRKEHLHLMKKMHSIGLEWAKKFIIDDNSMVFRLGYHSVPSMRQLHLHVISQEFDSIHLKNKKHWNSFNTAFFRDSVDVIKEIDEHGMAMVNDNENLLSTELRCHRCRSAHPNIPKLKFHIGICKVPFSDTLLQDGRLVSGHLNET
ncbi:hypothetical protein QJS10_CPA07g01152 [Acorus calamus]|uniref:Uncharacterized protein n=1 Tax=Acorus calamus TaxID=4465 RepID=A0AAV9EFJ0_ACOCL|nr:hypothetical protein QJS10_CPA07g01152 [Acorus calamus]